MRRTGATLCPEYGIVERYREFSIEAQRSMCGRFWGRLKGNECVNWRMELGAAAENWDRRECFDSLHFVDFRAPLDRFEGPPLHAHIAKTIERIDTTERNSHLVQTTLKSNVTFLFETMKINELPPAIFPLEKDIDVYGEGFEYLFELHTRGPSIHQASLASTQDPETHEECRTRSL